MTVNTYAVLRSNDITKLAKTKAPSCAILLYPLLLRYCQDKVSSYPGVKTLCRGLGDAYNERTVYRNLAWLVDNGFVKRKHRRSKERWTIVSRLVENTKKAIEKVIDTGYAQFKLIIPRGSKHGTKFNMRGKGPEQYQGLPPGDLIVRLHVYNPPEWETVNHNDLLIKVSIDYFESLLGTQVRIGHIDGKQLDIKVPKNSAPGSSLRLSGKGMPDPDNGRMGHLFVELVVVPPKVSDKFLQELEHIINKEK